MFSRDQYLPNDSAELQESNQPGQHPQADSPLLGRRLLLFLVLFFGGFCVSLRGWLNLDRQRRVICAAWIGIGWLISAAGLALSFATLQWPSTWGRWAVAHCVLALLLVAFGYFLTQRTKLDGDPARLFVAFSCIGIGAVCGASGLWVLLGL